MKHYTINLKLTKMKRNIEFRGKTVIGNKTVYGLFSRTNKNEPCIVEFENRTENFLHIVHENSIEEFTGLKDRNKKRVFEGDNVKLYLGQTVIIKFIDDNFVLWLDEKSFAPISKTELSNATIIC